MSTSPSTELAPAQEATDIQLRNHGRAPETLALSPRARARFSQGAVDLLASKYEKAIRTGADFRAFMGLLEVASELDLNPITNEIWLVKFADVWQPMVGRDGYVAIAKRDPDYLGWTGAVHREKDDFSYAYDAATGTWQVTHRVVGGNDQRGQVLGAWALLKRRGKPEVFFYADRKTYDKSGGQRKNAWDTHPDAMILKTPCSNVHRMAYGVSGALPADELGVGVAPGAIIDDAGAPEAAMQPAPEPVLPEDLLELLRRAQAVDRRRWRRNEVMARFPLELGPEFDAVADALRMEVTQWLGDNEPQDAEIVEEPAPSGDSFDGHGHLQIRWMQDAEWRDAVNGALSRLHDADAALQDDPESDLMAAQRADAQQQLSELGVPDGWMPTTPEQPEVL